MKIALICYYLTHHHSGQSRFLINLSDGLNSLNINTVVFGLYIDQDMRELLTKRHVEFYCYGYSPKLFYNEKIVLDSKSLSKKLSKLLLINTEVDAYVVLSDEAVGVVDFINDSNKIYVSQGDSSFLYYSYEFNNIHKVMSKFLMHRFRKSLKKHSEYARKYDLLLANSHFTKGLMSFLYEIPFQGIVYPPVATQVFKYNDLKSKNHFAVSLLRGETDPLYPIISRLSRNYDIVVVGGEKLKGLNATGFISDLELANLYGLAVVNLSPNPTEFFGYSIVESMSCGTPSIAFDAGGAPELIIDGVNGWIVHSYKEFELKLNEILMNDKSQEMVNECLVQSGKYTPKNSARNLVKFLKT